jgi:hypothetical protein
MQPRPVARAVVLATALAVACVRFEPPLRASWIDDDATFVAHSEHGGLAIDRSTAARMTRVEARGRGGRAPTFVVRVGDAAIGGLWLGGPAAVTARAGLTDAARITLVIRPEWVEQAIRLSIEANAGRLHTGVFSRVDVRAGTGPLDRTAQTNLDVRGVYRATVFDDGGVAVGWFEVRAPSPDEPRVFQGRLPPEPALVGPALAVALASELDWIDAHTIDVYRGSGRDRVTPAPSR